MPANDGHDALSTPPLAGSASVAEYTFPTADQPHAQPAAVDTNGAIVHEWIATSGGSERVLKEIARVFPQLPIWVLWADTTAGFAPSSIHESWIARTPLRRHKALAIPFMAATWRTLKSPTVPDWILASSHLFAHHSRFLGQKSETRKLVYAHTPARYIWAPELDTRGSGLVARFTSPPLRAYDRWRAQEPHAIAANSAFTQRRIAESWARDSTIIYPPVAVAELQARGDWSEHLSASDTAIFESLPADYILGASRYVPYKRLDLAIAAGSASGMPVVLAGAGPEKTHLRTLADAASVPVTFVDSPSDTLLRALIQHAAVYVFGAIEDFGIMPVEAMALGTPAVVPSVGGASESVEHGVTGAWFDDDAPASLRAAIDCALSCSPAAIAGRAARFDTKRFRSQMRSWVTSELRKQ